MFYIEILCVQWTNITFLCVLCNYLYIYLYFQGVYPLSRSNKRTLLLNSNLRVVLWLFIVNSFYMYILYKCYPNKPVFFIVFFCNSFTTRSIQGWNNNLISTTFQRRINVETTTLFQPLYYGAQEKNIKRSNRKDRK